MLPKSGHPLAFPLAANHTALYLVQDSCRATNSAYTNRTSTDNKRRARDWQDSAVPLHPGVHCLSPLPPPETSYHQSLPLPGASYQLLV